MFQNIGSVHRPATRYVHVVCLRSCGEWACSPSIFIDLAISPRICQFAGQNRSWPMLRMCLGKHAHAFTNHQHTIIGLIAIMCFLNPEMEGTGHVSCLSGQIHLGQCGRWPHLKKVFFVVIITADSPCMSKVRFFRQWRLYTAEGEVRSPSVWSGEHFWVQALPGNSCAAAQCLSSE